MRFSRMFLLSTTARGVSAWCSFARRGAGTSGGVVSRASVTDRRGSQRTYPSSALTATSFLEDLQQTLSSAFSTMSTGGGSGAGNTKFYTVGITGASGVVGTALRDELSRRDSVNGKPVRIVRLVRGTAAESKSLEETFEMSLAWNPNGLTAKDVIDPLALSDVDAIVHLAGENVATGLGPLGFLGIRPWTDEKKAEIVNSRVIPTKALAMALASNPKPQTFLVASGVGGYGANFIDENMDAVDESMDISNTRGFLAEVSRQWEAATDAAKTIGKNRVVNMRFGVVLSAKGGALAKLYPIFFLGGGGIVGSGRQFFSFISARDIARGIVHALETPTLQGPVNFSAPQPCTNEKFTKAFGKVLGRPTILPLPSFAVSLAFGEMGEEMLLGGVRALPSKLLRSGFQFQHPTIEEAIQSAVEEESI